MKTAKGLIEHCKKAVSDKWQYVYGAKGTVLTKAEILNLQKIYGKEMVWDSDLKKAGKTCCDCSGLISSYTGKIKNSTTLISECADQREVNVNWDDILKNWKRYQGYCIWRKGHIAVLSDKVGFYYAMDGSSDNAVHKKIDPKKWVMIGNLYDIDYSENKKTEKIKYYPKPKMQNGTLISTLDSIGVDSSKKNRMKIALKNGISDYAFKYEQNITLLNLLRKGKLKK